MKDICKWVVLGGIFLLPFVPLVVTDSTFFPFITGKNFMFRVIVEVIFAAWVILALYDPDYRPRFSPIFAAFGIFVAVLFFADMLGQHPQKSFWSNFERMEGFVTIAHLFLYTIVAGSVLKTEKMWFWFFNTTLFAAILMTLYVFQQISGNAAISQGSTFRVDGKLGNSTYLAVYMLFHAFISLIMLVRSNTLYARVAYGTLAVIFGLILFMTATRGAVLGLVGGLLLTTLYIAIFEKRYVRMRQVALGALAFVVVVSGLFIYFRDAEFIQSNSRLARIANISLETGETRFTIWGMAFEGFQERPILGWGQGNFNYVFNEYYKPSLYDQEQWFDRVHNIILDWLIAGGILGLLAYLAILATATWGASVQPLLRREEESFTVAESGLILGLLAGYFVHNLFVFDNIVSYILFATILAFVHARVSREMPKLTAKRFDSALITNIATPVVIVALVFTVYFVNVPHILASKDIIKAFSFIGAAQQNQQATPEQREDIYLRGYDMYRTALGRGSFADQEIREQIVRSTQGLVGSSDVPASVKERFTNLSITELEKQIEEKPEDARVRVFASSYYRSTGDIASALPQLEAALELSPKKQQIHFEKGLAHIQQRDYESAYQTFRGAYELDTTYDDARVFLAVAATYSDRPEVVDEVITEEYLNDYARSDLAIRALYEKQDFERLDEVMAKRIELNPNDVQERVSRAVLRNESGDTEGAIEVLREAIEAIPSFKTQGETFIEQIQNGDV